MNGEHYTDTTQDSAFAWIQKKINEQKHIEDIVDIGKDIFSLAKERGYSIHGVFTLIDDSGRSYTRRI